MDIRDTTVILLSTILLLILCQLRLVRGYDVAQISPIPRGQLWFRNFNASTPNNLAAASPRDYNFDSMNCGGVTAQWYKNGGNCGICGDDFSLAVPRPHESGGIYSQNGIKTMYTQGQTIKMEFISPSGDFNGNFSFELCDMGVTAKETELCFAARKLRVSSGPAVFTVPVGSDNTAHKYTFYLQVPFSWIINNGVMRTTITTGKNFGLCPDGTIGIGCGPGGEQFRICANVQIKSFLSIPFFDYHNVTNTLN